MRKLAIVAGILVLLAFAAAVGWRVYSGPAAPEAQVNLGDPVADLTLRNLNGQQQALAALRGEKGTLLIFISTRCPYSNAYNRRMDSLHRAYASRGIRVIGINANRTEDAEEVRNHSRDNGFNFPVFKDDANRVADYFGASVTPEAYLLDSENVLRYHGRLDADHERPELNSHELREALDALLNGSAIANAGKKAFGCGIKRVSG